jgi:RimJ/RimL family protein N-acetyltransferase
VQGDRSSQVTGAAGLAAVEAFWADWLGCRVADLRRQGTVVVTRPEPATSALALLRPPALVVAVPATWRPAAAPLERLAPAEAFQPDRLLAVFGAAAGEVVGPAYQGFTDSVDAAALWAQDVHRLGETDRAALAALRRAAGERAWEHSAIDPDRPPLFGRFAGGQLVAAATLEDAGEPVASVGVLTHPGHRGRGHGRAVAGAATQAAVAAGSVAHYQTLDANLSSVAVARALGYRRDATTLAVRAG